MSLVTFIQSYMATLRRDEKGAAMVEYGILVAGIAVLVMAAVFLLGGQIDKLFDQVVTKLGG
jgi:pilus assembly protein Flp/PilA